MIEKTKFCIGAGMPKSGSTSLFHFLADSKLFAPFKSKESNFLKETDFDISKYTNIFERKNMHDVRPCMEITPSYIYSDQFFKNIKEFSEDDTFCFLVVRDPVRRAISHYIHGLRLGSCPLSPNDFMKIANFSYTDYAKYSRFSDYLKNFSSLSFGRVYLLDELQVNNAKVLVDDIRDALFKGMEPSKFYSQFGKLPADNGTGRVPFVTRIDSPRRVKVDAEIINVNKGQYILERELVPYGYQYELITPHNDRHEAELDRLVNLSGKDICFSIKDQIAVREEVFNEEYKFLEELAQQRNHQINLPTEATFPAVSSRLIQ